MIGKSVRGLVAFAGIFVACGCGGNSQSGAVSGKVTLDGAPVENGSIKFMPVEGATGPTGGSSIEKGSYTMSSSPGLVPGAYRVEISSPRKTGKKTIIATPSNPKAEVEETVEAIPAKYNAKSTLRQEIKAGSNTCDFALTTDEK